MRSKAILRSLARSHFQELGVSRQNSLQSLWVPSQDCQRCLPSFFTENLDHTRQYTSIRFVCPSDISNSCHECCPIRCRQQQWQWRAWPSCGALVTSAPLHLLFGLNFTIFIRPLLASLHIFWFLGTRVPQDVDICWKHIRYSTSRIAEAETTECSLTCSVEPAF